MAPRIHTFSIQSEKGNLYTVRPDIEHVRICPGAFSYRNREPDLEAEHSWSDWESKHGVGVRHCAECGLIEALED